MFPSRGTPDWAMTRFRRNTPSNHDSDCSMSSDDWTPNGYVSLFDGRTVWRASLLARQSLLPVTNFTDRAYRRDMSPAERSSMPERPLSSDDLMSRVRKRGNVDTLIDSTIQRLPLLRCRHAGLWPNPPAFTKAQAHHFRGAPGGHCLLGFDRPTVCMAPKRHSVACRRNHRPRW